MQPTEKLKFLGMVTDSVRMTFSLPSGKMESISKWFQKLLKMEETTIRELSSFSFSEFERIGNSLRPFIHEVFSENANGRLACNKEFQQQFHF